MVPATVAMRIQCIQRCSCINYSTCSDVEHFAHYSYAFSLTNICFLSQHIHGSGNVLYLFVFELGNNKHQAHFSIFIYASLTIFRVKFSKTYLITNSSLRLLSFIALFSSLMKINVEYSIMFLYYS